jgi:hypothetical protein
MVRHHVITDHGIIQFRVPPNPEPGTPEPEPGTRNQELRTVNPEL